MSCEPAEVLVCSFAPAPTDTLWLQRSKLKQPDGPQRSAAAGSRPRLTVLHCGGLAGLRKTRRRTAGLPSGTRRQVSTWTGAHTVHTANRSDGVGRGHHLRAKVVFPFLSYLFFFTYLHPLSDIFLFILCLNPHNPQVRLRVSG